MKKIIFPLIALAFASTAWGADPYLKLNCTAGRVNLDGSMAGAVPTPFEIAFTAPITSYPVPGFPNVALSGFWLPSQGVSQAHLSLAATRYDGAVRTSPFAPGGQDSGLGEVDLDLASGSAIPQHIEFQAVSVGPVEYLIDFECSTQ